MVTEGFVLGGIGQSRLDICLLPPVGAVEPPVFCGLRPQVLMMSQDPVSSVNHRQAAC